MRARNEHHHGIAARWLIGLLAALSLATGWAQDSDSVPMPEPPAPAEAPAPPEADKQVRITRGEDGTLRIRARDDDGQRTDVEVDLGEEFGGKLAGEIYQQLERKGILNEQGLVVEGAMDSVPRNISIGISGELDGDFGEHGGHGDNFNFDAEDVLIPIVAIIASFGTPILIVWLVTRNSYRKKQLLMDNINRMVAEGRDIPPELLDAMEGESPRNMKDRGFTLIAVGLALFIWLTITAGIDVGSLGLIPLFIGLARFINWKLDNQSTQAG
ncbi:DUF6249 domain-containing protein [Microbulbifer halophilus]|uniref:DUF6249 domain-containing protein n=1 Tax=Microbulbifer halophilus TaxID=453963 RepID=A0ABW5EA34_9GAMM|nr:DUF6249 domain-containing protein [Microbulbifer halophilus]MCW8127146.1 DUF6249 domain-containing protein [Microbulbifer halophilus]